MKDAWRLRDTALFAAAMMVLWGLSPRITGQQEAWDSDAYYLVGLAVAGFAAGLFASRPSWWMFAGTVLGQILYPLIFLQSGPLAILGCVFAIVYSALPAGAGIIAVVLRSALDPRRSMPRL